jgi:hypothetical protein
MILLDTRELDHPIPLEMAVDAFRNLRDEEVIHMLHRREPLPLYEIIVKNGGRYRCISGEDGVWHIFITRSPVLDLEGCRV